jgi:hypothetical protein
VTWPCKVDLTVYEERVRENEINKGINSEKSEVSHGTTVVKLWGWYKEQTNGNGRVYRAKSDETVQSIGTWPMHRFVGLSVICSTAIDTYRDWKLSATRKTSCDVNCWWRVNESVIGRAGVHNSVGIVGSDSEVWEIYKQSTPNTPCTRFQGSAAKLLRTVLVWIIKQRVVVILTTFRDNLFLPTSGDQRVVVILTTFRDNLSVPTSGDQRVVVIFKDFRDNKPHPSHSARLDHPNNIGRGVQGRVVKT